MRLIQHTPELKKQLHMTGIFKGAAAAFLVGLSLLAGGCATPRLVRVCEPGGAPAAAALVLVHPDGWLGGWIGSRDQLLLTGATGVVQVTVAGGAMVAATKSPYYPRTIHVTSRQALATVVLSREPDPTAEELWARFNASLDLPGDLPTACRQPWTPPVEPPSPVLGDPGPGTDPATTIEHTVLEGESLEIIAEMYEVPVATIRRANPKVRGNADLKPNMTLLIPFK